MRTDTEVELRNLEFVARQLPFSIDDVAAINDAFVRSLSAPSRTTLRPVLLWTYCFVRRYYLLKIAAQPSLSAVDLEVLMDQAYRRIDRSRTSIRDTRRYAQWVSVVCRHLFLNYLKRHPQVACDPDAIATLYVDGCEPQLDDQRAYAEIEKAILRLPAFIQEVARLRLVDEVPYDEIAILTNKSVPTVRSFFCKALHALRADPQVVRFLHAFYFVAR